MRRTVTALLLLVSGAAAAVAQTAKQNPPAPAPQTGHCDIGVMSILGKTTFSAWNGGVINGRRIHEDVPIESWHVDDLVVDRFRAALGNRAAVERIPYRKEDIQSFGTPLSAIDFLFNARREESLRRMTTGMRCARYVIVSRGATAHGDSDDWSGLGIRVEWGIFGTRAFVHAVIAMRVYDGKTFAPLRERSYEFMRKVDESFWPNPPKSAAQNAKLREVTRELVARSLDTTLPKLPLTP